MMRHCLCLLLACFALLAQAAPETLRIHVVPIVNQEHFLERVLEPFAREHGLALEITAVHGREVARAAREGRADLVIVHTKFPGRHRLVKDGVIVDGTEVFANPIALLGPPDDPAGVAGAADAAEAMARIRRAKACVLENDLDGLVRDTRALAGADTCYRREKGAVGLGAVQIAAREGWYTWWGLHPFALIEQPLRAFVWPEARLLRPLNAAVVADAPAAGHAAAAVAWLRSPAGRAAIEAFRLARFPAQQAFWAAP
jgi:hypothetical protein